MPCSLLMRLLYITALLLFSSSALAHHPGHISQATSEEDMLALQISVEHAEFDLADRTGTWTRMALEAEYAPWSWLRFGLNAPLAYVREEGKAEAFGMADMEIGVMTLPYRSSDGVITLGLGANLEVPSGSASDGLGGGHLAIIPKFKTTYRPTDALTFNADLYAALALGAHSHGPGSWHSPLAIHSLYELALRVRASYDSERFITGLGFSTIHGLAEPEAPGPSSVFLFGAIALSEDWMITSDFEVPFAGERRNEWRVSLGVRWTLSRPQAPQPACECADGGGCDCGSVCEDCE